MTDDADQWGEGYGQGYEDGRAMTLVELRLILNTIDAENETTGHSGDGHYHGIAGVLRRVREEMKISGLDGEQPRWYRR